MNSNKNTNNNHGSDQELDGLEELKHDGEIEHSQIVDYVDHLPEEEREKEHVTSRRRIHRQRRRCLGMEEEITE